MISLPWPVLIIWAVWIVLSSDPWKAMMCATLSVDSDPQPWCQRMLHVCSYEVVAYLSEQDLEGLCEAEPSLDQLWVCSWVTHEIYCVEYWDLCVVCTMAAPNTSCWIHLRKVSPSNWATWVPKIFLANKRQTLSWGYWIYHSFSGWN